MVGRRVGRLSSEGRDFEVDGEFGAEDRLDSLILMMILVIK